MKHPVIVYGTRPEYIKLKPVIKAFEKMDYPYQVIQIGQHDTSFIGENTHRRLEIPKINSRLNDILGSVALGLELDQGLVVVHGDTATSLAVALNAYNVGIPVAHVEAGLRTYDLQNPYPEEGYRQMIDRISTLLFVPRGLDKTNLYLEKVSGKVFVTGNTVIDNLPDHTPKEMGEVYITLHRRENRALMTRWMEEIDTLSKVSPFKFYFITHPSLVIDKAIRPDKVTFIDPVSHDDMVDIVALRATVLITDSGGIQEEAAFYNKPVVVCRKATERPFAGMVLAEEPEQLVPAYYLQMTSRQKRDTKYEFGDGTAGVQIAQHIKEFLS